jgi:hypothetical protein
MRRAALTLALSMLAACSAEESGSADFGTPDLSAAADFGSLPPPPALGQQIDRMGRAAINTALTDPFYLSDPTSDGTMSPMEDAHKDGYNADVNQAMWPTAWSPAFEKSLAVFDAIDGVCGNQLLASPAGADAGAGRYAALAAALADDQLYLDLTRAECGAATNYLAVEARFALGQNVAGCGGRTPLDDTIDATYTLLAEGAGGAPLGDGIDHDADPSTAASLTSFPFLNPPNP